MPRFFFIKGRMVLTMIYMYNISTISKKGPKEVWENLINDFEIDNDKIIII